MLEDTPPNSDHTNPDTSSITMGDIDGDIYDSNIARRDIHPATIQGNVETGGGDFIGRDQNIYGDVINDNKYIVRSPDEIPLSTDSMQSLLTQYRQQVLEDTRYLSLEGIPLPDAELTSTIPLQRVYIHVQALELRQSQKQRLAEEQALLASSTGPSQKPHRLDLFTLIRRLGEYQYRRGKNIEASQRPSPVDPIEAIRKDRHLVMLGAPGSGKSTLLRYVAHQTSQYEHEKVVIYVRLGNFALAHRQDRQLSLFEWAFDNAAPHNKQMRQALRQAAQDEKVVWLFDGLDETNELREETSRQISWAMKQAQIVVTSRPLDYRKTHLEQFTHFEVLPLTTANVEQFITDWLTILAEQQGYFSNWVQECSDWLQKQLAERPRIQELMQNPLLLTFLVILARHDPRQDLPTRRSELYRRYIEELFSSWEQRRSLEAPPLPRERYLWGIEAIAWYLHLGYYGRNQQPTEKKEAYSPDYFPSRSFIQQRLALALCMEDGTNRLYDPDQTASQIINFWITAGLIEERQRQQWGFLAFRHLTFQEYGVANVLYNAWQKDADRTWLFLKPRLHHFASREAMLLLAEQMKRSDIDRLLHHLLRHPSPYDRTLQRDLFLAATLAGENGRASPLLVKRITNRLIWQARTHHLTLVFIWLFLGGVFGALGSIIAWLLLKLTWLVILSGLGVLTATLLAILLSRPIRSSFCLLTRQWIDNIRIRRSAAEALVHLGSSAVESLIAALKDNDSSVYWRANKALNQISDVRAIEPLIAALKDNNSSVRRRAAQALGRLGNVRAVEPLVAALKDNDSSVRWSAAEVLGQLGDVRAVEPLIVALKDNDSTVRWSAAEALGQLGDIAVKPLIDALKDNDSSVRWSAAKALGQLGDVRAVESLSFALKDNDSSVGRMAAKALGQLGDVRAVKTLIDALKDSDSDVRQSAVYALDWLDDVRAVEPLIDSLKDNDFFVRRCAAKALGQLGDVQAIESLIATLKDNDFSVRDRAAQALGQLGDIRAVEPLVAALKDNDFFVRRSAAYALDRLDDVRAVEPLIDALKDNDSNVRRIAAYALSRLGDVRAVEPLVATLNDNDFFVRRCAAYALDQLENVRAVEPLKATLKDNDYSVHRSAAESLNQLGDVQTVESLVATLKDNDYSVRRCAAESLGQLGDVRAVESLIAALNDNDYSVRRSAAYALGQLGDVRAIKPLVAALNDNDYSVRSSVAYALGGLGDVQAIGPLIVTFRENHSYLRGRAAEALGRLGNCAVEPLIATLKDNDYSVRSRASEALGQLGDARAIEPLIAILKDNNYSVRWSAAQALSRLLDIHAVDLSYKQLDKIALSLWWRLTDENFKIEEMMFEPLSTIVNQYPVTVAFDDLFMSHNIKPKRQFRWWLGTILTATLVVTLAAITGVLGNLLTQLWNMEAREGFPMLITVLIIGVVSVILVIISQRRTNDSIE